MKPSYRFALILSTPLERPGESIAYAKESRLVNGVACECYAEAKWLTVGCRVKFYDDGCEADIIGSYWLIVDSDPRRLKLSLRVQYEDGSGELIPAALLRVATCLIKIPFDYETQLKLQSRKKAFLKEKFDIQ